MENDRAIPVSHSWIVLPKVLFEKKMSCDFFISR